MELRGTVVCRACSSTLRQPKRISRAFSSISQRTLPALQSQTSRNDAIRPQQTRIPRTQVRKLAIEGSSKRAVTPSDDLITIHNRIEQLCASALQPEDGQLPSEQRLLYVLEQLESIAEQVIEEEKHFSFARQRVGTTSAPKPTPSPASATSALLGSVNSRASRGPITPQTILTTITTRAEEMLRDPTVFITPAVLKAYVTLQSLLSQPASFPDIFHLYAHKPLPTKNATTGEVTFTKPSPDKVSAAIDPKIAHTALSTATAAHDLALAIDIITTSFSTTAFKRAKILRRAAIPMAGLGLAPCAAYVLSNSFSHLQTSMDEGMASGIAFAGIMTYVSAVSMVGYVAVTTANDQMDRVTWASGVPLWERWVREEERAAIDFVAGRWGFQEVEKKGDEEGEDWEFLREWIGLRGMVLDKVGLMEGME